MSDGNAFGYFNIDNGGRKQGIIVKVEVIVSEAGINDKLAQHSLKRTLNMDDPMLVTSANFNGLIAEMYRKINLILYEKTGLMDQQMKKLRAEATPPMISKLPQADQEKVKHAVDLAAEEEANQTANAD